MAQIGEGSGWQEFLHSRDPINDPTYISPIGNNGEYIAINAGDKLTPEQAKKLAELSNGALVFDEQSNTLKSADGKWVHNIDDPLEMGDIHELHHTVMGSGGAGSDMNPSGIPQPISAAQGSPAGLSGGGGGHAGH